MPINLDVLINELLVDTTIDYTAMSDTEAAAAGNDATTGRTLPINSLTATELYEAIDTGELDTLITADPAVAADVDRILGLGTIDLSEGSKARAVLISIFPAGAGGQITREAIVAATKRTVSRFGEIGLGFVYPGHVQTARL